MFSLLSGSKLHDVTYQTGEKTEVLEVGHRCSAIIANRRHTRCITTSFHRQRNRLWRNGTERMEFPGREQTRSIPISRKGTTGHCQNQMGPDVLFITSPWGATSKRASNTKGLFSTVSKSKIELNNDLKNGSSVTI